MPSVDKYAADGSSSGTVDLDDALFGIEPNVGVMHQVVTAQLAAGRRATSKVKTRGEVRGGGRKPWRQKGTGRARQGSIRAVQWSGGGVAHGPTGVENYTKRVNKKLKRLALRSALSDRTATGDLRVVDGLDFDVPSTKGAAALLDAMGVAGRKVLLVLAGFDANVIKSFRNLPPVHILTVDQLNTYDVLASDVVVIESDALELIGTGRRSDLAPATGAETPDMAEAEAIAAGDAGAATRTSDPEGDEA
ncbi:50S ribosomal protein L4 [Euzebya sp.]|uniref:50S ribosomal protein L4 n=1 Tax=Euzebya sp. TaxID=1971409 RepID=UPI003516C723